MSDVHVSVDPGAEIDSVFEEVAAVDASDPPAAPDGAALDQVREILLGQHTRTLEQRLTAAEQRMERAVGEITAESNRRIKALEASIKSELATLIETLGAAREERSTQYKKLQGDIEATTADLDLRVAELTEKYEAAAEELRSELQRQVNSLTESVESQAGSLMHELTAETSQLRAESIDRGSMASLLQELATKLISQPMADVPGTDEEADAMLGELLGEDGDS